MTQGITVISKLIEGAKSSPGWEEEEFFYCWSNKEECMNWRRFSSVVEVLDCERYKKVSF